jgi:predicted NAD-dependent protein-ADP-ribosyltransferase YbiA (DUF1768 family)
METVRKTSFTVFGVENAFCLLDDYIGGKACISAGIEFRSVRHAVLSHKTFDRRIKQILSSTILPADLKDLESLIPKPEYWNKDYILKKMHLWTLYKFKANPDFGVLLKNTGKLELIDNLHNNYGIAELKDLPNYRGKILMDVRKLL